MKWLRKKWDGLKDDAREKLEVVLNYGVTSFLSSFPMLLFFGPVVFLKCFFSLWFLLPVIEHYYVWIREDWRGK